MKRTISEVMSSMKATGISKFPFRNGQVMIIKNQHNILVYVIEYGRIVENVSGTNFKQIEQEVLTKCGTCTIEFKGIELYDGLIEE